MGGARDELHFALYDPASGNGTAFAFDVKSDETLAGGRIGPESEDAIVAKLYSRKPLEPWTQVDALPSWLEETTRSFVSCSGGACRWSLQLRMPLDPSADPASPGAGIPIGADVRLWYDAQVNRGACSVDHRWPDGADDALPFATVEPDVWRWERVQLGNALPSPADD